MRGLSLTQPYASLVALGVKRFETRSWSTSYRGPLAIHAAKGLSPVGGRRGLAQLCGRPHCWEALSGQHTFAPALLPRGAIVAVASLTVVHRTEDVRHSLGPDHERELAFGDFGDGRYAWRLDDVVALPQPIACRGALGLWTLPEELWGPVWRQVYRVLDVRTGRSACRECGCTDNGACENGCYWVEPDLCSSCAPAAPKAVVA